MRPTAHHGCARWPPSRPRRRHRRHPGAARSPSPAGRCPARSPTGTGSAPRSSRATSPPRSSSTPSPSSSGSPGRNSCGRSAGNSPSTCPAPRTANQPRPAPLVPAALGSGVGRLVAVLFAVGLTVATTPAPSLARPATPPAALVEQPATPAAAASARRRRTRLPPRRRAGRSTEHDNLWDIAERALGDGARATEILELNPAVRSARDLRAGQLLRLPDNAAVPADQQIPPLAAPGAADAEPHPHPATWPKPSSPSRPATPCGISPRARLLTADGEPAGSAARRFATSTRSSPPTPTPSRIPTSSTPASSSASPPSGHHPRLRLRPTPSVDPPPASPPAEPDAAVPHRQRRRRQQQPGRRPSPSRQ